MSFMSWLPGALKELLRHVPTILFDVVSWSALSKDATQLSKRLLTKEGSDEARRTLAPVLPDQMTFSLASPKLPQTPEARKMLGEKILSLYFKQITQTGPMFLDLRLSGFSVSEKGYGWNPTSLWAQFTDGFVEGIRELYNGFYFQDNELFKRGLVLSGLVQESWSEEDKEKMASLFKAHFGQALDAPMKFKLDEFQKSFQSVFSFLLEKKVKLTTDFLLLGVMLVTLYLSLEELGGDYPVAEIYRDSQK
ncbi:MAG: hypothetical protein K2P81_00190 [Bacteriovoracaceae bacterium]|nr:hypothetical protein [Bacteriovoracaceae bacterium]